MPSAGAILCFHSVTTPRLPGAGTVHVPLPTFTDILTAVAEIADLVPLRELVKRHLGGRSTSRLVAVTCDDAYVSLLTEAEDFLRRAAVPVTVFVVTEAARTGGRFWWDRLDDAFPHASVERWNRFEEACGLPDAYRRGQPRDQGRLRPLRQWVLAQYAGRWRSNLEPHLAELEQEIGTGTLHRSMTFEEIERLAALPSVDIGVHTRSHAVLPLLPDAELRGEIEQSYRELHERLPQALPILAVPFGLFDKRVLETARAVGMTASLTLGDSTLRGHARRDDLPRFCISREDRAVRLQLRLAGPVDWVLSWTTAASPRYPALPSATT